MWPSLQQVWNHQMFHFRAIRIWKLGATTLCPPPYQTRVKGWYLFIYLTIKWHYKNRKAFMPNLNIKGKRQNKPLKLNLTPFTKMNFFIANKKLQIILWKEWIEVKCEITNYQKMKFGFSVAFFRSHFSFNWEPFLMKISFWFGFFSSWSWYFLFLVLSPTFSTRISEYASEK